MPTRLSRLTSHHLQDLVFLSDPRLTADGQRGFCVRTRVQVREDGPPRYHAEVCEVDLTGDDPPNALRALTTGRHDADHPRPSPDGTRLAFLAKRAEEGERQVHILDLARGGEAHAVTTLASGAGAFAWRPDGRALVVLGSDAPPAPEGEVVVARTVARLHAKEDGLPAPGIRTAPARQAWFVDPERGRTRVLTDLPDGVTDAAWAPDGRTLWLLAADSVEEADDWYARLWRVGVGARGNVTRAPRAVTGPLLRPASLAVAPDGTAVYWLGPNDPEQLASPTGAWRVPAAGGTPTLCSGAHDVSPAVGGDARHGRYPAGPVATGDGLMVIQHREGASVPALLTPNGELHTRLPGERATTAFAHAAGRTLCVVETPTRPGELTLIEPDGSHGSVSAENADAARRFARSTFEGPYVSPEDAGGAAWWRLLPAKPRRDHALVVQVHGGPHTSAGYGFSFEHHLLAARGYTVVIQNPRGSASYGAAHALQVLGAYGGGDADDVLGVVDAALSAHADPAAPVHLAGGSYGGFMTNWLVGRTDRFRSAVTQRSICNWISFYGTSDIGYRFAEYEVAGTPWADLGRLWDQSPLKHVANVTTPTLVLHAEADHRCPIEQAEQWFTALKRLGRADTKLVRFPDEGHELSRSGRPDRRMRRLDEIVGWFEGHA
ncbi:MAG: S9 family peptidase [Trueperaceae bacterium]|nr:S9 family peptidase [Trueperaceae bacterium]